MADLHEAVISSAAAQADATQLKDQLRLAQQAAKGAQEKLDAGLLCRQDSESKVGITISPSVSWVYMSEYVFL